MIIPAPPGAVHDFGKDGFTGPGNKLLLLCPELLFFNKRPELGKVIYCPYVLIN